MIEKNLTEFLTAIKQNEVQIIDKKENEVKDNINKYCENPLFYSLNTEKIKNIIIESEIDKKREIDTICNILNQASKYNIENAPLLLSCFNVPKLTLDECVKIISSLNRVPICKQLGKLYEQIKENYIERDWDYELKKKQKEIEELKIKLDESEKL